jgi:hypothetical protein
MEDIINSKEYHKAFKTGISAFHKHMRSQGFNIKVQNVQFDTKAKDLDFGCPKGSQPETVWNDVTKKWETRCSRPRNSI